MSLAGDRIPLEIHANARSTATCHTATVSPIAAVATAVPRYPPAASRPRRSGSLANGPEASLHTPVNASATPSIAPSAAGPAPRVVVRNVGSRLVTISWLESDSSDAPPLLTTPTVSQPRSRPGPAGGSGGAEVCCGNGFSIFTRRRLRGVTGYPPRRPRVGGRP